MILRRCQCQLFVTVRAACWLAFVSALASPVEAQPVTYQARDVTTPTPEGYFRITGPTTCTIPDGGYLMKDSQLYVDVTNVATPVTGYCDVYVFGTYYWSETRYLNYHSVTRPEIPSTHNYMAPYNVQGYDTQSNYGSTTWVMSTPGTFAFNFLASAMATSCQIPTNSGQSTKSVNVLSCGPEFKHVGAGNIPHPDATNIDVYVPASMSDLNGPIDDAISDWNTGVNGTGLVLSRVTSACSGPTCIAIAETSVNGCASASTYANSDGTLSDTSTITFTTGYGAIPSWRQSDPTALRRTAAHEIGHVLGMNHPTKKSGCNTPTDGVMLDAVTTCQGSTSGYATTLNDTIPVVKTTYGGGPEAKCGF